ncbi:hypothetical protein GGR58DRAFT_512395 [Xylaria digitata]|nr:hypothetical protein GGR58DRAFT_512395 [Xylaria digitata]
MNSAGVIRADGDAKVHVGDNYSIVHNHLDSNLTERDKAKLRTEFLLRLFTSPYEDRKNRNPKRADGTCEWFTAHRLFQHWRRETSALLWVTTDPGCGKSVLARYLVDDLFIQRPTLLSDEILEDFREERDQIFASFHKLWDMLIRATKTTDHGEIICILDALDECLDQIRLAHALTQHYGKGKRMSTLKFLITSRPYLRIQRGFQTLEESQPTIHLNGESQEEQRIEQLCKRLRLSLEEKQILHDELTTVVFAAIEEAVYFRKGDLRTVIRNLPPTVEEAYNDILCKSYDPDKARNILHIIVAADRPLYLKEMAAVLAFQGEIHRCHEDLRRDLPSLDRLRTAIRETCGLFVVIQDSQVFLLHQTAREFLIQLSPKLPGARPPSLEWQHSFNLQESHRLISEICIRYLLLAGLKRYSKTRNPRQSDDGYNFVFLDYAASNWTEHYRQAHNTHGTDLERLALQLCDTNSTACSPWLEVYGKKRRPESKFFRELRTSLLITSYFGLENLVNLILQRKQTIPRHQVIIRDKLSLGSPTIINQTDKSGKSPLWYSAVNGHRSIVQALLKRGAKVDTRDGNGLTPLSWAAYHGHGDIVALLLEKVKLLLDGGAEVNASDIFGKTALMWASIRSHDTIVQLLLNSSAEVNASDTSRRTTLKAASEDGHSAVVKVLLDSGADIDALDFKGRDNSDGCFKAGL